MGYLRISMLAPRCRNKSRHLRNGVLGGTNLPGQRSMDERKTKERGAP